MKRIVAMSLSAVSLAFASGVAWTAGQYGPGASDTEIKIGNTMPYSGPASALGVLGKSEAAYFAMNDTHGLHVAPGHPGASFLEFHIPAAFTTVRE